MHELPTGAWLLLASLTTPTAVGTIVNVDAVKLYEYKVTAAGGMIVEIVVWQLPQTDTERPHGLKYRLFYGRGGERLVCYDNERGKGDHRHVAGFEEPYTFISLEQLIEDFKADVRAAGGVI